MSEHLAPASNEGVVKEAAYWVLRLHDEDCSKAERQAFQNWVQASPEHAFEYAKMLEIWDQAERPAALSPRLGPTHT
ncbi:ferric-dicitrate binding protein FerR (iron transport regulator) [Pseudomonas sp. TE3786]